ncbi:clathrin adaptor, mu subunit [Bimuria novae-zelandiae CBS 107.79]|uniref:Clathrin adaptor, mu subunit n=1 Tax=Bimuria novae-zelandiae CBS 107.79 TaxID=1447943 RepID=A0A6A5VWR7_9PLEO|nr:clathrin adaptor, mu subunit [Bimuria novae-zelandiae CBS 107.79]
MSPIEALYIFDENNTPLLEHTYAGRPPSGSTLLPLYLAHPKPRPSLVYLPNTNPPTLLYSVIQDQLLLLCPTSSDTEPLQVLEFLHRVTDALEDFLGGPLLASKIESHYDVIAQLLGEMVDGGLVSTTEPNALRDVVDAPSTIKSLLAGVGLPSSTPSSSSSNSPFALGGGRGASPRMGGMGGNIGVGGIGGGGTTSTVPWRRANVRHTSNEMYVDIVETLHVTLSPSGRPLAALANGMIAFTAKVSGVPDLLLQLGCPGGISNAVSLPTFHPCVRLNRWRDHPGELSFVPPDGRFTLAGYEVDLLGPAALDAFSTTTPANAAPKLNIPATVSVQTSLGPTGSDFEVRLQLNPRFKGKAPSPLPSSTGSSFSGRGGLGKGLGGAAFGGAATTGTTAAPAMDGMVIHVPVPSSVKTVVDLKVPRGSGEAVFQATESRIRWAINSREIAILMSNDRGTGAGMLTTLRGTVVGHDGDEDEHGDTSLGLSSNTYDYDDDQTGAYQSPSAHASSVPAAAKEGKGGDTVKRNKVLMPSCATISFTVKGWLPSGIKVEALTLDQRRSKGLGAGVQPYKGVKYLCVSRKGVETRC